MDRRETLKILAAAALGASVPGCGPRDVQRAAQAVAASSLDGSFEQYTPRFFSEREMQTLRRLADLVIPADERSGNASEARVPEFVDFMASENDALRTALRGGLAWIDGHARRRFSAGFFDLQAERQTEILDDIAWPESADPAHSHGVRFFSTFRDLCAAGFFSSRMGMADIGYMGNSPVLDWNGCPSEALVHVGTGPYPAD